MQDRKVTASQLRAARAVLGWTVGQVAALTGIGIATIKRYEAASGVPKSRKSNLATLASAYEASGIEFIGSHGNAPGIRVHDDPDSG